MRASVSQLANPTAAEGNFRWQTEGLFELTRKFTLCLDLNL